MSDIHPATVRDVPVRISPNERRLTNAHYRGDTDARRVATFPVARRGFLEKRFAIFPGSPELDYLPRKRKSSFVSRLFAGDEHGVARQMSLRDFHSGTKSRNSSIPRQLYGQRTFHRRLRGNKGVHGGRLCVYRSGDRKRGTPKRAAIIRFCRTSVKTRRTLDIGNNLFRYLSLSPLFVGLVLVPGTRETIAKFVNRYVPDGQYVGAPKSRRQDEKASRHVFIQ